MRPWLALLAPLMLIAACASTPRSTIDDRLSDDVEFQEDPAERHPASEHVRAGEARLVAGDAEGAETHFRAALEQDPADPRAHLDLGLVLELTERYAPAEAEYREALTLDPDFPEAMNNLGLLLCNLSRAAEAVPLLQRAVELRPAYGEAHLNLGIAFEDLGQVEEATAAYRRASRLAPSDALPRLNLGLMLAEAGQTDAARVELRRAQSLAAGDASTLAQIGRGLRRLGDAEAAMRALRDARGLVLESGGDVGAGFSSELALAEWGAGERAESLETLAAARAAHPGDATLMYVAGRLHAERGADGDEAAAREAFQAFVAAAPEDPRVTGAQAWLREHPAP